MLHKGYLLECGQSMSFQTWKMDSQKSFYQHDLPCFCKVVASSSFFFILQFMVCWPSFNFLCIPCVQEPHTANKQSYTFKCRKQAALYNSHTIAHWFMGYQLNSMKWLLYMISVLIAIIWKSKAVGDGNPGQSCVLVCCILMPTLPNALYFALNDTCW